MSGFEGLYPKTCREKRVDSSFATTEMANSIFYDKQDMYGVEETFYSIDLIPILDKVFTQDNLHIITVEQQRYLQKYFKQAGSFDYVAIEDPIIGTIYQPTNYNEKYNEYISKNFKELDNFLGSYLGE